MRVDFLRDVYEATGPFATCHLDASRDDESGGHQVALRWSAASEELRAQGAPDRLLELIGERITSNTGVPGPHGRLVVGAGERIVFDGTTPGQPHTPFAEWSPLPRLVPYLRQHAWTVPHVVALVDRAGGEVSAYGPHGGYAGHSEVDGETLHLRKVPDGGWSQKRYQRGTENVWRRNAHEVAEEVGRLVAEVDARTLVLAGDLRARTDVAEQLDSHSRTLLHEIDTGSRADGASQQAFDTAVDDVIAEVARQVAAQRAELFAEQRGKEHAAAEGLAAVVEAAREARIATLLLASGAPGDRYVYAGPQATQLAMTSDELSAIGATAAVRTRADSALLRVIVATDAEIEFVPEGGPSMREGIGALLRWSA